MNLLVVGAGAVGRWFAREVGQSVAFTDRDPDVAAAAADEVGGRAVSLTSAEEFDLVCLAVPISATTEAIARHADTAGKAMIDCSGVMGAPLAAMADHAPELERASLHPLFAPEQAPGRVAVVREADGPTVDQALDALGRNHDLFETTAEAHDAAMSTVQAKVHAAILAYGLAAEPVPDQFHTPVSEALDRLVDRVTAGNPQTYREIQDSFPGADDVADAARELAEADGDGFEQLYRDASR